MKEKMLQMFGEEKAGEENGRKPTWDELMEDPEYNGKMQETVRARLKGAKDAEETLRTLEPVLQGMRQRAGVQDDAALAGHIRESAEKRKAQLQGHLQEMMRQSEEVRKVYPGFDLAKELRDSRFAKLTAPGFGVDVRTAYEALHREEIAPAMMAFAARKAQEKLAGAVRSGGLRPPENGSQGVGAVLQDDPRNLSKKERADIRRRVRSGEKIVW